MCSKEQTEFPRKLAYVDPGKEEDISENRLSDCFSTDLIQKASKP